RYQKTGIRYSKKSLVPEGRLLLPDHRYLICGAFPLDITFSAPGAIGPGALVVGIQDAGVLSETAERADKASGGAIKRALSFSRFKGQAGQSLDIVAPAGVKASRFVLVGLGKADGFDAAAAERLAATVLGRLFVSGEQTLTFAIDPPKK